MADWVPVQEILPVFLCDDTKARSNRISKGQTIQAITDEKKADGKGVIAKMKDRIKDITETDIMDFMQVKNPHNEEALWKMKRATPARIGIGHVGPRYTTEALLRFRAAHAAANDAVFQEVPKEDVEALGVFEVRTRCSGKREMLLRPDWGRSFDQEAKDRIVGNCIHGPQVQIYFGDGLCSPSIRANIPDLFPTIKYGLEDRGITVGTPFFVRYCRVNTARVIGPLLGAQVTCVLIGERPGLLTAESMSAYIAYHARADMQDSEYTVVSNISRHGIPPVEAAAHIVDLIADILMYKKSGVAFSALSGQIARDGDPDRDLA